MFITETTKRSLKIIGIHITLSLSKMASFFHHTKSVNCCDQKDSSKLLKNSTVLWEVPKQTAFRHLRNAQLVETPPSDSGI